MNAEEIKGKLTESRPTESLSGRGSPVSESRRSEDATSGVRRPSSTRAILGSRHSRSPSSETDSINQLSSRRKRVGSPPAQEPTTKHLVRETSAKGRSPPLPRPTASRTPRTLQPEDVDDNFVRKQPDLPPDLHVPHAPSRVSSTTDGPGPSMTPAIHVDPGVSQTSPPAQGHLPTPPQSQARSTSSPSRSTAVLNLRYKQEWPTLALQPQSRPVFQEHLAAEVKSIYNGLTQVETKCVHIDRVQQATPRSDSRITNDHWQAMIALHRTLLHEHHDFFLASQHPAASPALKRLAIKYSMPARMWKHGIHSFLELLRHRLPESLEYMLSFIYLAYQMISLLYETVPTFRNTWIECLGDLGRYRMAVEDENVRDREIWAGVARSWYNRAADTNPAIGRLFHHLAILARPNMVQQLYLYNRSLTSCAPFHNARESIVTIFEPVLAGNPTLQISSIDLALVKIHAHLFKKQKLDLIPEPLDYISRNLFSHIESMGDKWLHPGAYIAIANIGALFDYGNEQNPVRFIFDYRRKAIQQQDPDSLPAGLPEDQALPYPKTMPVSDDDTQKAFRSSLDLVFSMFKAILSRKSDSNVLPFLHVTLVFILHLSQISEAEFSNTTTSILDKVPWPILCWHLNMIKTDTDIDAPIENTLAFEDEGRPLPEDWMLRGLSWSFWYFPRTWFKDAAVTEEEERYMEWTSTMKARVNRVLSLAMSLAKQNSWIKFENGRFSPVNGELPTDDPPFFVNGDSPLMEELIKQEEQSSRSEPQSKPLGSAGMIKRQYNVSVLFLLQVYY